MENDLKNKIFESIKITFSPFFQFDCSALKLPTGKHHSFNLLKDPVRLCLSESETFRLPSVL